MALYTYSGAPIERAKPVGKRIGGRLYVHKRYAEMALPLEAYKVLLHVQSHATFPYECLVWNAADRTLRFDTALGFNEQSEPCPGRWYRWGLDCNQQRTGISTAVWHHKWLWVLDDYPFFDVAKARAWSARWLAVVKEQAIGTSRAAWLAQLQRWDPELLEEVVR